MANWKVVTALMLFFPLGLYWMFKHTDWSDKIKWIISAFFALLTGVTFVSELFYELLFLLAFALSIASVVWFINAIVRRKQKRNAVIAFVLGIFMFVYSINTISEQTAEAERVAQEELLEQERLAEEEKLEEERLAEEQRLKELEEKNLGIATEAVANAEETPTRSNYDKALELVSDLSTSNDELDTRLANIEEAVIAHEEALNKAIISVDKAEEQRDRDTYDEAYQLVSSLAFKDDELTGRLDKLDDELTLAEKQKAEEERLAKEKAEKEEAERKAAEEKAEAEKRAAEEKASTEEAQSSGGNSGSSSTGDSSQTTPPSSSSSPNMYVDQNGNGTIKGSNSGIYHVPGSTYYDRTTNVAQWFKTVEEAQAAGYRAPKR